MERKVKQPAGELCGIEFRTPEDLDRFLRDNPKFYNTARLAAGPYRIMLLYCHDFPTRDTREAFTPEGRHWATFIGPDALEHTWQIRFKTPPGGYGPQSTLP